MEESMKYTFGSGRELSVVKGEDGYTVNISGGGYAPKMGTFTSFEEMLYGIAPVINESKLDVELIAMRLSLKFDTDLDDDEIEEILLK